MGRGRQKAKHTKVARELKYFSPDTNYGALEKELATKSDSDEYVDRWADDFEDDSGAETDLDDDRDEHDQSKSA
ncbi:DUF3073 domain-containing protein [Frigoribacterium sp. ACAM 257]|uniref:DUF3073 domain-containing protein n=1 Tax=Frigoribacterium sp. ACAM 257 TaxID=2508998 RepID=UPI0011B95E96|nr:DUF3073 domain-containing protein [Frigoribacterium sp. ACAM 257]TWX35017.1 DUF3073 domain-containing protein [Frigoribacterium sp. ACAM 257]